MRRLNYKKFYNYYKEMIQIIESIELGEKEDLFKDMFYSDEFNFLGCNIKIHSDSLRFIVNFVSLRKLLNDNIPAEEKREYFIHIREGLIFFKVKPTLDAPWVFERLEPFPILEEDIIFGLTLYLFSQLENHFSQWEKNYLFLHSGSVAKGNKVVLLIGNSGMGKTTLTLELLKHNFTYLSDEYGVIIPGTLKVIPFLIPPKFKVSTPIISSSLFSKWDKKIILLNNFWKMGYFDILSLNVNKIKDNYPEIKHIFFISRNRDLINPIITPLPRYIAFKKLLEACKNRCNVLKSYEMLEALIFILDNVKFYNLIVGNAEFASKSICELFGALD